MVGTWKRGFGRLASILAIGAVVILVAAPLASGQSALDQYVPTGNPAGGNKGGGSLDSPVVPQAPGEKSAAHKLRFDTGTGTDKGGKLPLTDYPSTPFIWIVVAILVAGALIRIAVAVRNRRGTALETG
jgi:hypothetical protein